MKKLLIALMTISSISYAANDCSAGAQEVVDKLAAHNRTSVTLTYSADNTKKAETCKAAILAKNSAISVNLVPVESKKSIFKFSK